MPSFRTLLARMRTVLEKDEFRVPVQTASAVLLAYGMMTFFDLPEVSWAAFSALFVVQASIGGTIGTALSRVAGALIGTVLGLLMVVLWGMDGWHVFAALFVGVASMGLIAARWPALSYGLVTVTIIIATPDFQVVEGALEKVVAISIGSFCGMIAAIVLLPVAAHRSADAHLAAAVRACGEFLVECMKCLTDGRDGRQRRIDQSITRALNRARDMSQQADIEKRTPAMRANLFPDTLPQEVERFRYTLTLVDRISDRPLSEESRERYKPALQALAKSAQAQLNAVASAISACSGCEEMDEVWECYHAFSACVDRSVQEQPAAQEDTEQLMAMKWAYHSVLLNMNELTERVNARTGERK